MKINNFLTVLFLFPLICFAQEENQSHEMPPPPSRDGQQRAPTGPMMSGPSPTATIAVGEGYVFVISKGQLMKFDEQTLSLKGSIPIGSEKDFPPKNEFSQSDKQNQNRPSPNSDTQQDRSSDADRPNRSMPGGAMRMPKMMNSGSALAVANGSVYVLFQGKLSKYDVGTLDLKESVEIESKPTETLKKTPPLSTK